MSREGFMAMAVTSSETASKPFAGRGRRGQGPKPASPVREAQPLRPAQSLSIIRLPSAGQSVEDQCPFHCEASLTRPGTCNPIICSVEARLRRASLPQPRLRTPFRARARVATLSSDAVASAAARQERHRAAPFVAAQTIRAMSATVRLRTILAPSLSLRRTGRDDAGHARPSPSAYRSVGPRHPATRCATRRGIAQWSERSEDPLRP